MGSIQRLSQRIDELTIGEFPREGAVESVRAGDIRLGISQPRLTYEPELNSGVVIEEGNRCQVIRMTRGRDALEESCQLAFVALR